MVSQSKLNVNPALCAESPGKWITEKTLLSPTSALNLSMTTVVQLSSEAYNIFIRAGLCGSKNKYFSTSASKSHLNVKHNFLKIV